MAMIEDGYCFCLNKWALDKEIKSELPLLLVISSLTAKTGYCFASNKFFSMLFNELEVCISRRLKKLSDKGYIIIEYKKRGCEVQERKIRLANRISYDYQNCYSTISKIAKEKNISNKNIKEKESNNINIITKEKETLDYPPEHERDIKWSGSVISLNFKDYYEWKKLYPNIDLDDMLTNRDNWLRDKADDRARRNWFISTKAYFKKLNEDIG